MVVKRVENPGEYGVCETDSDGRILRFAEKPGKDARPGSLVNTGIYFLERSALERIPEDGPYDFGREMFPAMLAAGGRLHAIETDAYWCDIGNPAAYARAQGDLLAGRVALPVPGLRQGGAILGRGCSLAPGVRIEGRCYVGSFARVDGGTVLGAGTVIGSGATVGRNVHLENACLWAGAQVDGGAILKNVVVIPQTGHRALQRMVSTGGKN